MKRLYNSLLVKDDKIYLWYFLLAIPFSIFVVWIDKDTCFRCWVDELVWGQWALIVIGMLGMALMVSWLTNIVYNILLSVTRKTDAFFSALIIGFIANLILMFIGVLILWPVLLPTVIVMLFLSWKSGRKSNNQNTTR
jgi:hypothetical protein